MDLNAPIIPGISAAGVNLGHDIFELEEAKEGTLRRSIACGTVIIGPVRLSALPSTGEITAEFAADPLP